MSDSCPEKNQHSIQNHACQYDLQALVLRLPALYVTGVREMMERVRVGLTVGNQNNVYLRESDREGGDLDLSIVPS
jgi:hypothetical protein